MLLVDSNEPKELIKLLRQAVPVEVVNLNLQHMSDYFFSNYEGKRFQFSRKQAAELVGDIDEAERQISSYYEYADENFQIVEGIISPTPLATLTDNQLHALRSGKLAWKDIKFEPRVRPLDLPTTRPSPRSLTYTYKVEYIIDKEGSIAGALTNGRGHNFHFAIYYVWRHRLAQCGVVTYETINWVETAKLLATIYRNEQKPPEEHTTLKRIIKPRIHIEGVDPFVKSLLFLSAAYKLDIGETRAKALATRYVNLLDLAMASIPDITEVEGIGAKTAKRLLAMLGRDVQERRIRW